MADNSAIEWTDATWNPVTGCTKITRGCDNCYAARFAERWRGVKGHPYEQGFDLRLWPARLDQPSALAQAAHDLRQFDERPVPQGCAARIHRQCIRLHGTGRPSYLPGVDQAQFGSCANICGTDIPAAGRHTHIWCGFSVEDSATAGRVRHLQAAPAAVRFLSVEPLLGPVSARSAWRESPGSSHGGESGPDARPHALGMGPRPARPLRSGGCAVLLQTVGRRHAESRRPGTGRRRAQRHARISDGGPRPCPSNGNLTSLHRRLKSTARRNCASCGAIFAPISTGSTSIRMRHDVFKLDLVDGFAGGGTFLDEGDLLDRHAACHAGGGFIGNRAAEPKTYQAIAHRLQITISSTRNRRIQITFEKFSRNVDKRSTRLPDHRPNGSVRERDQKVFFNQFVRKAAACGESDHPSRPNRIFPNRAGAGLSHFRRTAGCGSDTDLRCGSSSPTIWQRPRRSRRRSRPCNCPDRK